MKALVDVKEIKLPVNGREMTFSEEELIVILEQYFNNKETGVKTIEVTQVPIVDKCFDVNPSSIDQNIFKKKRKDSRQEWTRQIILEAFIELKNNPEKYAKPFKTMWLEKTWSVKTVEELKKLAENEGDHITNWVEQALEWAQRIANGETWEAICNVPDTAKWYRLVIWKNGKARLVGGASEEHVNLPASYVGCSDYLPFHKLFITVPSVVLYE